MMYLEKICEKFNFYLYFTIMGNFSPTLQPMYKKYPPPQKKIGLLCVKILNLLPKIPLIVTVQNKMVSYITLHGIIVYFYRNVSQIA